MIKYTFLGMWWLGVLIVNGIIALVEWIINRNATDSQKKLQIWQLKQKNDLKGKLVINNLPFKNVE